MGNMCHKIKNDGQEDKPRLNGNETVLVVDDIEDIRSFLKEALPMFGYSVICAEDGMDGLSKFRENKDNIDVMQKWTPLVGQLDSCVKVETTVPHAASFTGHPGLGRFQYAS